MRTISLKTQPVIRADRPAGGALYFPYNWFPNNWRAK
jgi:hypothetical protein